MDPLGATYDEPVELPDGTVRKMDAFELCRPRIEARGGTANVVVVGHFPHVDRIQEYARLTVLERNCSQPLDTPDPACEYVLPQADFAFVTGVTIINKTAPRLLDLAKNATTVFVGPSVVMSPFLFDWGVEMLAGSVVADPDKARFAVEERRGRVLRRGAADGLARARGRMRNSPLSAQVRRDMRPLGAERWGLACCSC